jgi:hypothetical protein
MEERPKKQVRKKKVDRWGESEGEESTLYIGESVRAGTKAETERERERERERGKKGHLYV